jgi:hypothetical protein
MTALATHVAGHDRRRDQHDEDVRSIYRELRWVRRAMHRMMGHMGIEPPGDEEE